MNKKTKNIHSRNRKRTRRNHKRKTRKMIGSASIEQIGKASAMRSWLGDNTLFRELSKIVHSADKFPDHFLGPNEINQYADKTLSHDNRAETLLGSVRDQYIYNRTSTMPTKPLSNYMSLKKKIARIAHPMTDNELPPLLPYDEPLDDLPPLVTRSPS